MSLSPSPGALARLAVIAAVYALVAWFSLGYDDEFYNIALVERSHTLLATLAASTAADVHPVGQYALDFSLYWLLGDWSGVRVAGALALAFALWRLVETQLPTPRTRWLAGLPLVALHPTVLMWGSGLRWTGYFTALYVAAFLWAKTPQRGRGVYWGGLAALLVVLLYLNFYALVLAVPLVAFAVHQRRGGGRAELRPAALALALAAIAALPPVWMLATRQARHIPLQTGSLLTGVSEGGQAFLVNFGLFPLSWPGLACAALTAALAAGWLYAGLRRGRLDPTTLLVVASVALLIGCGLGAKARNFTPLLPVFMASLAAQALRPETPRAPRGALAGLAALQAIGLYHVAAHVDTAKGAWNYPVAATLAAVRDETAACGGRLVVAVYDPTFSYYLAKTPGVRVVGPFAADASPRVPAGECLVALRTFRGSFAPSFLDRMIDELPASAANTRTLGPDRYAAIKRRFDPDVPDAYVILDIFGPLAEARELPSWRAPGLPRP